MQTPLPLSLSPFLSRSSFLSLSLVPSGLELLRDLACVLRPSACSCKAQSRLGRSLSDNIGRRVRDVNRCKGTSRTLKAVCRARKGSTSRRWTP